MKGSDCWTRGVWWPTSSKTPRTSGTDWPLLEPGQNFRIHRLEMQRLCQKQGGSVEDFYIRIKTQALKCKYAPENVTQERILEQVIAGSAIPKVQRELLSKDDIRPHSSRGIRHCKGTWGEHQTHEADTRSNIININHWCGQQQQINMPATTTASPPKADSFTPNGQTSDKPAPAQTALRCSSRHAKPPQRLIENM